MNVIQGKIVKLFANPVFIQAVLLVAFGKLQSSIVALGNHLEGETLTNEIWAFTGMLVSFFFFYIYEVDLLDKFLGILGH